MAWLLSLSLPPILLIPCHWPPKYWCLLESHPQSVSLLSLYLLPGKSLQSPQSSTGLCASDSQRDIDKLDLTPKHLHMDSLQSPGFNISQTSYDTHT